MIFRKGLGKEAEVKKKKNGKQKRERGDERQWDVKGTMSEADSFHESDFIMKESRSWNIISPPKQI